MKDNFSTTPYMSSNLREYNRIYKEVNDIYRDAASKFGLSNSVFDIYIPSAKSGRAACKKMSAMLLLFQSRLLTPLFVN